MKYSLLLLLIFWSNLAFGQYSGDEIILYQKYATGKQSGETQLIEKVERSYNLEGKVVYEARYEWLSFQGTLELVEEWSYEFSEGLLVKLTNKKHGIFDDLEFVKTYSYADECPTGLMELESRDGRLEKRRIFEYVDCSIKSMEQDVFIDDDWVLEFREEYSIRSGIETRERFAYSDKEDSWILTDGNYIQRDGRGNVLREENRDYLTSAILSDFYEYDLNDTLIKESHYEGNPNDILFTNVGEFHYEFDENYRIINEYFYKGRPFSSSIFLSGKKSFEYVFNEDGQVIEQHIDQISQISPSNGHGRIIPNAVNYFEYFCDGKLRKKSYSSGSLSHITELYHYQEANPCLVPISDSAPESVFFYPNPATSIVTFQSELLLNSDCEVYLFDAVGKLLRQEHIGFMVNESQWDISDLAEGVYFIKLFSEGRSAHGRLFKIKE